MLDRDEVGRRRGIRSVVLGAAVLAAVGALLAVVSVTSNPSKKGTTEPVSTARQPVTVPPGRPANQTSSKPKSVAKPKPVHHRPKTKPSKMPVVKKAKRHHKPHLSPKPSVPVTVPTPVQSPSRAAVTTPPTAEPVQKPVTKQVQPRITKPRKKPAVIVLLPPPPPG